MIVKTSGMVRLRYHRNRGKPIVKKKFSGPRYEKELKRKKSYERKVLKYLKEHGPQNYDHLVIELDRQNTGNIAIALQALLQGKHIKRHGDDIVITEAGLRLHEDGTYWI
jgi:hypothetical protein